MTDGARAPGLPFALLLVAAVYGLLAYASLFGRVHYRLFNYLWDSEFGWALLFIALALGLARRWYFALFIGKYAGLVGAAIMFISAIAALLAPEEVVITLFRHELAGYPVVLLAILLTAYSYWQYKVLAWYEMLAVLKLR